MIDIQSIKTIKFLAVIDAAGVTYGPDAPHEIWEEIMGHVHGNQVFTNDSIFKYVLPSINGEELSPVQEQIRQICWAALEEDDIIYFEVSW